MNKEKMLAMFEKALVKKMDTPAKVQKYANEKEVAKKAISNAKRAMKNGEQFVGGEGFKKNTKYDRFLKQVKARNGEIDRRTAQVKEMLSEDIDAVNYLDDWKDLHSKEIEASEILYDRKWKEYGAFKKFMMEGINEAEERGDLKEAERIRAELEKETNKIKDFASKFTSPSAATGNSWDLMPEDAINLTGPSSSIIRELKARADGVNMDLPKVDPLMKSNKDYLTRFHTTKIKNLPSIFRYGLQKNRGGQGYGEIIKDQVDKDELNGVYTISTSPSIYDDIDKSLSVGDFEAGSYTPWGGNEVTLELHIPKKDYRKMKRMENNPEENLHSLDRQLETVQNGGRTDILMSDLKPEYIRGLYTEDNGWNNNWRDILNSYDCDEYRTCDEWFDNLSLIQDVNGNWTPQVLKKLKNLK